MKIECTQAQLDALYQVYLRWQNKTPHNIMPLGIEIISEDDYKDGNYLGVWVGDSIPDSVYRGNAIYLGIEKDGHTHS